MAGFCESANVAGDVESSLFLFARFMTGSGREFATLRNLSRFLLFLHDGALQPRVKKNLLRFNLTSAAVIRSSGFTRSMRPTKSLISLEKES